MGGGGGSGDGLKGGILGRGGQGLGDPRVVFVVRVMSWCKMGVRERDIWLVVLSGNWTTSIACSVYGFCCLEGAVHAQKAREQRRT